MKTTIGNLVIIFALLSMDPVNAQLNNMDLSAIESATPLSADELPAVGAFYSSANPRMVPLPANFLRLPAWPLGHGMFLLDDLDAHSDGGGLQAMDGSSLRDFGDAGNGTNQIEFNFVSQAIDTNGLWLQMVGVSNGMATMDLCHATDLVYEAFSRESLTDTNGWNIEEEIFPTNTDAMPFCVSTAGRDNCFFWARDWTGVDENSNGIADWWEWKYFRPGTLAYHLSTNAVARTNGFSNINEATTELANWTYDTYSGTNLAHLTNAVWSTNFWLKGVQGLSATCIGYSNGVGGQTLLTMVSPRHYLDATYVGVGQMIAFLDTNNVIFWRRSVQRVDISVGPIDTSVGILNEDLPPSVEYLPILPPDFTNYLPASMSGVIQGIGMNQDMRLFSQPMMFINPYVNWNNATNALYGLTTNWNVMIRGGDSSDPEMLLIGNQLVLASHNLAANFGPNYAFQIDAINQQMHYLSTNNNAGSDYQLTLFSLTNWPTVR